MTIYNVKFVLEVDKVNDVSTHEDAYSRHLSPEYKQKEFVLKELANRMYLNKQQTENLLNYFLISTDEGEDFDIALEERY
jgi:hypothetical protein|tara:strand:- start:1744 stop:1983 length:240 start_codon:yes stop_codon:yes gene_type:complete